MTEKEFFGDWAEVIDFEELHKVLDFVSKEMKSNTLCPSPELIFKAFSECPYSKVSVVMLGQSPYPQANIATGLCFANKQDIPLENYSPSLKVLYDSIDKYCKDDLPFGFNVFPTLEPLAHQGILLLNSALTIRLGQPDSHINEWRKFIGKLIENLSVKKP